jgi:hypothetical protein
VQPVIREVQRRKADIIIGLSHAGKKTQHGSVAANVVLFHVPAAVAASIECSDNRMVLSTRAELQQLSCSVQCDSLHLAAAVVHYRNASCQAFVLICMKMLPNAPRPLLLLCCPAGYDSDLQVAAAVPELDLIIGGHSHTFLANSGSAPIVDTTTNATDTPVGPYPTYVNASTTQNPQK